MRRMPRRIIAGGSWSGRAALRACDDDNLRLLIADYRIARAYRERRTGTDEDRQIPCRIVAARTAIREAPHR